MRPSLPRCDGYRFSLSRQIPITSRFLNLSHIYLFILSHVCTLKVADILKNTLYFSGVHLLHMNFHIWPPCGNADVATSLLDMWVKKDLIVWLTIISLNCDNMNVQCSQLVSAVPNWPKKSSLISYCRLNSFIVFVMHRLNESSVESTRPHASCLLPFYMAVGQSMESS